MNQISVVVLAAACALLTTAGQILIKVGVSSPVLMSLMSSGNTPMFVARAVVTPLVMLGLCLYVASSALWLVILARSDVSFAFPLVSMGFILTAAYAHFALHESLSATRLIGILLILLGVVFISRS